jgi:hypothetical protein
VFPFLPSMRVAHLAPTKPTCALKRVSGSLQPIRTPASNPLLPLLRPTPGMAEASARRRALQPPRALPPPTTSR